MPRLIEKKLQNIATTQDFFNGILDLSNTSIEEGDLIFVKRWLEQSDQSHLVHLKLSHISLSASPPLHYSANSTSASLSQNGWLELSNTSVDISPTPAHRTVKNVKLLELVALFETTPNWQNIDLSNNNLIAAESNLLLNTLKKNAGRLRELKFDRNVVGSTQGIESLASLVNKTPHLKYISLSYCKLNDANLEQFLKKIQSNTSIRKLTLCNNPLSDQAGSRLLNFLSSNETVIEIDLENTDISNPCKNKIAQKLGKNRQLNEALHKKLLSPDNLFEEAQKAIQAGKIRDLEWIRILLGCPLVEFEESFASEKISYTIEKRLITFKQSIIPKQLTILHQLKSQPTTLSTQEMLVKFKKQFNQVLSEQRETMNMAFMEDKAHILAGDFLDNAIVPDKQLAELKVLEYETGLSDTAAELMLILDKFGSLVKIEAELQRKSFEIEQRFMQINDLIAKAKTKHKNLRREQKDLSRSLSKLKDTNSLSPQYLLEFEELKPKLIQLRLDPNAKNTAGKTLLDYAIDNKRSDFIKLLLEKGANPIIRGQQPAPLRRVLDEAQTEDDLLCRKEIIKHIKDSITEIWPNYLQEHLVPETTYLQSIKNIVDNYLKRLEENIELSLVIRLFTGEWHVADRADDCVQHLRYIELANAHGDNELINKIIPLPEEKNNDLPIEKLLGSMIHYAEHVAKRGLLKGSSLNDTIIEQCRDFLGYLTQPQHKLSYQIRLTHAQNIHTTNKLLWRLSQENALAKSQIEELNTTIKSRDAKITILEKNDGENGQANKGPMQRRNSTGKMFFGGEKRASQASARHLMMQSTQFKRYQLATAEDCGYSVFGITRQQAYELILANIAMAQELLKPIIEKLLLTRNFIHYLQTNNILDASLATSFNDYQEAIDCGDETSHLTAAVKKYALEHITIEAYIRYDICDKRVGNGWSHPCVLQSLASLLGITLYMWQLDSDKNYIPHPHYPHMPVEQTKQRVDLLLGTNNRFERLELVFQRRETFGAEAAPSRNTPHL